MSATFVEKVKKHFSFLMEEYGFVVTHEENSKRGSEIEGVVIYSSQSTIVSVNGENGGVGVGFGRTKDSINQKLTVQIVYEFENLDSADRAIVISHNPLDDVRARALVLSKELSRGTRMDSIEQDVERQLAEHAHWLNQYADSFLRGDFTHWLEIYEYQVQRMRAEYIRSGKEEFVKEVGLDKSGKLSVLGKRSTFQSNLEYLEKLKIEYEKKSEK